ncbi:MAG: FHA domain-containing protein [Vicinamibacterales bacterium]
MTMRFGRFQLDLDTRQLRRDGREQHLSPKAFDLLAALVADRPKVLSKAALQERLWPDTFVSEANLSNLIAEVRAALGDNPRAPVFIRTAHGFGYAFCAEADGDRSESARACTVVGWFEWRGERRPVVLGEQAIGRDPDVDIRLNHSTVSRRHARVVATAGSAMIEDLSSKNGTHLGGRRISQPMALTDGDEVRIGSVLVTFHSHAPFASTDTSTDSRE